jgi:sugar lactone lactonase YvrE
MRTKFSIALLVILLLALVGFMVWDFYYSEDIQENPYAYDFAKYKQVDKDQILYSEIDKIEPQLESLKGLFIDEKDQIYVSGGDKILVFDANKNLIKEIETQETANCISIDQNGNIYLAYKTHIDIINADGETRRFCTSDSTSYFTSIALNEAFLFVADAGQKIVHKYNLNGQFLSHIGVRDSVNRKRGFIIPSPYFDLLLGRNEELWVVNPGRHTFEAYSFDGELISSWKRSSMQLEGFSGCCNPSHVALLSDGSYVTSEKGIERVKIHAQNGDFKCVVAEPSKFKKGTKGLDLAVDSKDQIYVLDPEQKQVRVFRKKRSN